MMDDPLACVTLNRAAELIGGDRPVSRTTIQRMVNAGILEARGAGRLRRITLASVDAYRSGKTIWGGDTRTAVPRFQTATARGGRVRLIGKIPKGRR